MTRRLLLTAALAGLAFAPLASAENWPQWRGPHFDGHSAETGLPTAWGPDKNVVWKLPMPGRGECTPCVWGDRIFLTSEAGTEIVLLCVGTDGKERWRKPLANAGGAKNGPEGASDASASCSTDGKHVWSYVGGKRTGKLSCHDVDGTLAWEKNLQEYGKFDIQFGTHWTPVLYQGRLYLQVMHRAAELVVALDAATGKEIWKVPAKGEGRKGTESPDVYASATFWVGEGGSLLITHGNDTCAALRLDDGAEVWRVTGLNPDGNRAWRFVSCPMVSPDLIVVPSCKNGPTVGINPVGAKGEIGPGSPAELWRIKPTPDVLAPLRVGDIVYLLNNQTLTAVDAKTGKQVYQKALEAKQRIYRSNLVVADGKIYIIGREGIAFVIQAGKEFKVLGTSDLKDTVYASPAVANGRLYIRTFGTLYCIGTK
jgi:outer membrane protein assembly factor BamB